MPEIRIIASSRGPMTQCRSCKAAVRWAKTHPGGKPMILHGDPVAVRTSHTEDTHELVEHIDTADVHWAKCPDYQKWKRPAGPQRS